MNLKEGVSINGLRPQISAKLSSIEGVFNDAGSQLTLTCTTGSHKDNDPHTHGFAIDCRTAGMTPAKATGIATMLQHTLGDEYYVQYEARIVNEANQVIRGDHIHIQYRKDLWHAVIEKEKYERRNQAMDASLH